MKKRIACVTGCRSEYDILYSVLKKISEEEMFELQVIVTGAHLSERFGYTVDDIVNDGFEIADRIYSLIDSDKEIGKIKSSGNLILGLSDSLNRLHPDYVMVVGDREEAIISAIVCTYMGIPLVHICGGDRTFPKAGDVDEPIRHATSKMASIHCTTNAAHKERLLRMGEEPWRVFNTGNPGLDRFAEIEEMTKQEVLSYFSFDDSGANRPLVFVLQHVISGEVSDGASQLRSTLDAVTGLKGNCIVNYPNSDMGSREMIRVIEEFRELPHVRVSKNIPRKQFVNLLRNIDLLVGNSSMALLEGCFLKIPALNVGERNKMRMNGGNVIFVDTDTQQIRELAERILIDNIFRDQLKACESIYGDGKAADKIVDILKSTDKTRLELTAKNITY